MIAGKAADVVKVVAVPTQGRVGWITCACRLAHDQGSEGIIDIASNTILRSPISGNPRPFRRHPMAHQRRIDQGEAVGIVVPSTVVSTFIKSRWRIQLLPEGD
jgi:hypothetical protein